VRVDVHKAGRDQQGCRVDLLGAPARNRSHGGDGPGVHRDVGHHGFAAPPVGHLPTPDHEVVCRLCHALPLSRPRRAGEDDEIDLTVRPDP